jgi:hypothetical protein
MAVDDLALILDRIDGMEQRVTRKLEKSTERLSNRITLLEEQSIVAEAIRDFSSADRRRRLEWWQLFAQPVAIAGGMLGTAGAFIGLLKLFG